MTGKKWLFTLPALRLVTLVAPPIALLLLWFSPAIPRRQKILGSIGIPLFTILYLIAVVTLLHLYFGITLYEWRGGYIPTLTLRPTLPNYEAVETQRAQQRLANNSTNARAGGIYWTQFRGPNRDGVYAEQLINTAWDSKPPTLLWHQPIGGGYASFSIAHGVAYTIEQRREKEVATAYEMQTGRELWAHGWDAEFKEPVGGDGPRATPTWNDGRIYAQGAAGELRCLDATTGALIWRHDILNENFAPTLEYGASISPLVVDDLVVTLPGGPHGHSVIAYDRISGKVRWTTGDDGQAYVSPIVTTLAGERQLLVVAAKRTLGLRISDGRLLWEFAWGEPFMGRNIAQPVVWNGNRIFLSAGYDSHPVAIEITSEGRAPASPTFSARELWRNRSLKNKFTSSIFWRDHLYGLDEDILTCVDAATGQRKWKDGRYGYGQLILADGHLIILCGNGDLALVKATSDHHEEIGRIPAIKGKTWNHPALADGKLLIRNLVEMACYDLSAPRPGGQMAP